MMTGYRRFCLVGILVFGTVACGTFPVNPALKQFDPQAGYRFNNLQPGPKNTDELFVILTFSGGGTRAAALSYGVLKALEQTTIQWNGKKKSLLDEVDLISSVSGGSFTAAYYGLHRKSIFEGDFEQTFLKHDIQGDIGALVFNPGNWFKLAGNSYSRGDLAADYYNEHIFNGATFGDLIGGNTRPFIMVNATDMTLGGQFPFIQDQLDLICSDLSGLEIARAVASSSAFPGLLSPLTFENYAGTCDFVDYPWVAKAENDRRVNVARANRAQDRRSYYDPGASGDRNAYVHLIDGGVSDNIGLRGPLYAISSPDPTFSILRKINNREIRKLVIIIVNAATSPSTERNQTPDVPGVFDTVLSAATIPIDHFSENIVQLLKQNIQEFNSSYQYLDHCDQLLKKTCGRSPLDLNQLPAIDLYVTEVAFDYISDPAEREKFKNISTNFHLPGDTVDQLETVGCTLLASDPEFKKLIGGDPGYTGKKVTGTVPDCG